MNNMRRVTYNTDDSSTTEQFCLHLSCVELKSEARPSDCLVNKTEENRVAVRFSSSRPTAGHVEEKKSVGEVAF